jgi:hypothetical protein
MADDEEIRMRNAIAQATKSGVVLTGVEVVKDANVLAPSTVPQRSRRGPTTPDELEQQEAQARRQQHAFWQERLASVSAEDRDRMRAAVRREFEIPSLSDRVADGIIITKLVEGQREIGGVQMIFPGQSSSPDVTAEALNNPQGGRNLPQQQRNQAPAQGAGRGPR